MESFSVLIIKSLKLAKSMKLPKKPSRNKTFIRRLDFFRKNLLSPLRSIGDKIFPLSGSQKIVSRILRIEACRQRDRSFHHFYRKLNLFSIPFQSDVDILSDPVKKTGILNIVPRTDPNGSHSDKFIALPNSFLAHGRPFDHRCHDDVSAVLPLHPLLHFNPEPAIFYFARKKQIVPNMDQSPYRQKIRRLHLRQGSDDHPDQPSVQIKHR